MVGKYLTLKPAENGEIKQINMAAIEACVVGGIFGCQSPVLWIQDIKARDISTRVSSAAQTDT